MVLLLVGPVWIVPYPPLVDYPNHLARAFILAHLDDPGLARYYAADWGLNPYLLMDLLLVALQKIVSIEVAGRLLLTVTLLALPLAVWFFLRAANPGQESLAAWSLLFCHSFFFLTGLVNLQLSLALCFVVLGLWLRYVEAPRPGRWALLALATTLLYLTHLMGFGVALTIAAWLGLRMGRERGAILRAGAAFLPGLLLLAATHFSSPASSGKLGSAAGRPLVSLNVIEAYSPTLDYFTFGVVAAAILLAWWKNPEFRWNGPWLEVCLLLYVVYWILPFQIWSGTYVYLRLVPFYWVAGLAAARVGRRALWLLPVALLLFAVRTAHVTQRFVAQQPFLHSLARSFDFTPDHARVLPLVQWRSEKKQLLRDYSHFWAYGVIGKRWFVPYLFHDPGVHPLRLRYPAYRPEDNGYMPLIHRTPPDWNAIRRDYDYVWAFHVPEFTPQLDALGTVVYESGDLRVYRMAGAGVATPHPR